MLLKNVSQPVKAKKGLSIIVSAFRVDLPLSAPLFCAKFVVDAVLAVSPSSFFARLALPNRFRHSRHLRSIFSFHVVIAVESGVLFQSRRSRAKDIGVGGVIRPGIPSRRSHGRRRSSQNLFAFFIIHSGFLRPASSSSS